jgi:ribosomal-protein-alanine N-acetyltransferase
MIIVRRVLDEAEILTLAVDPAWRRQGLGQALVTAAADHLRGDGAARVFLEVNEVNASARRLYQRLGFHSVGRRPGYYRGADGTVSAALLLARHLGDGAGALTAGKNCPPSTNG